MDISKLIEKLSIQVDSIQERFTILSKSKTMEDLAKNFCHILRGSLMVSYVNLYFKSTETSTFSKIHEQNDKVTPDLTVYGKEKSYSLHIINDNKELIGIFPHHDNTMFVVICGRNLDQDEFGDFEKISLQLFAQLLDNAYQSLIMRKVEKDLIFTLNNRILQMNNLIDTGIELSKGKDESLLLTVAIERAVGITNASGGQIIAKSGNKIKHRISYPATFTSIGKAVQRCKDSTIEATFKFQGIKYQVTLYDKESRQGMVPFDETDRLLLDALTRQAHAAIENEFLQKQSLEMETVKREMAIAATIQQRILPEKLPDIPGYDLAGKNIPAIEVCGDYYDIVQVDDNKYALIMADVSGKGVPAALLVSSLQASLRVYLENNPDLSLLTERLNKLIYQSTTSEKYLTMSICYLNTKTGAIEAVNAGHNPPLITCKNNTIEKIVTGGIPVGMADMGLSYDKQNMTIEQGESLLMFTDGITEAMDLDEEMYEDDRLETFLLKNRSRPATEFIGDLIEDVEKFVGNAPQSDDITALYLKRL
jgi:sigma-B regulation protein RsbU (phosphoserine phosphatase)